MGSENDHLLHLRKYRQVWWEFARVHIVLPRHQERNNFVILILITTPAANGFLQVHLKPPFVTTAAGLHL